LREAILFTTEYLRIIPYKVHMKIGVLKRLALQKKGLQVPKTPAIEIKGNLYTLSEGEWKEEKANCLLKKRISVTENEGEFSPAFLNDDDLKPERIGSDMRRSYRQKQIGVHELSNNKFAKFAKLIISVFVVIMVVGVIVAAIAILGKISTDQAAVFQGGLQNSGFLNNFTSGVLGG